MDMKFDCGSLL